MRTLSRYATVALFLLAACGSTAPADSAGPTPLQTGTTEAALCNSGCSTPPKTGTYQVSEISHGFLGTSCPNPPWANPPPDLFGNIFPTTISFFKPCSVADLETIADNLTATISGNDRCNPPSHILQNACQVNDALLCQLALHDPTIHDHFQTNVQFVSTTEIDVTYTDQAYQPTDGANLCQRFTTVKWVWISL